MRVIFHSIVCFGIKAIRRINKVSKALASAFEFLGQELRYVASKTYIYLQIL